MGRRLLAASAGHDEIAGRSEEDAVTPDVGLHPNLAEAYRRDVGRLAQALALPGSKAGEAGAALRSLVEGVAATPKIPGADAISRCGDASGRSST